MEIRMDEKPNALIVSVAGKMDATTTPKLEKAISDYMEYGKKTIILNFGKLEYISSSGIRAVLFSSKQLKAKKLELLISELNSLVKDVFELSGLYSIFNIFETVEAAQNHI